MTITEKLIEAERRLMVCRYALAMADPCTENEEAALDALDDTREPGVIAEYVDGDDLYQITTDKHLWRYSHNGPGFKLIGTVEWSVAQHVYDEEHGYYWIDLGTE